MEIRKADFAGSWYPREAEACEKEITRFLADSSMAEPAVSKPLAAIVPHAGWYFSGSIACNTIHRLYGGVSPTAVVIFGMHLHPRSPLHMMVKGAWETPFGLLPVAEDLAQSLRSRFEFKEETPFSYTPENTIELQLPFVRYFFGEVRILPIGVPPNPLALEVAAVLVELARVSGCELKFIGSTDLTHYGLNYGFSPRGSGKAAVEWVRNENDRQMIDAMLAMHPEAVITEALEHQNACCAGAAAAAIHGAKLLGADHAQQVAYATSYDKSPGDSLVGYTGIVIGEA